MLFAILAGISAVLEIGSTFAQISSVNAAAEAQKQAIKTREMQEQYKIEEKKAKQADLAMQYLTHNEMVAVNRGESMQSPSFNAIQRNTLIHAQQALQNDATSEKAIQLSSQAQMGFVDEQKDYQKEALVSHGLMNIVMIGAQFVSMSGGTGMPSGRGSGGSFYGL